MFANSFTNKIPLELSHKLNEIETYNTLREFQRS